MAEDPFIVKKFISQLPVHKTREKLNMAASVSTLVLVSVWQWVVHTRAQRSTAEQDLGKRTQMILFPWMITWSLCWWSCSWLYPWWPSSFTTCILATLYQAKNIQNKTLNPNQAKLSCKSKMYNWWLHKYQENKLGQSWAKLRQA